MSWLLFFICTIQGVVFLFGYYVGASRIRLKLMDLQENALRAQTEAEDCKTEAMELVDRDKQARQLSSKWHLN